MDLRALIVKEVDNHRKLAINFLTLRNPNLKVHQYPAPLLQQFQVTPVLESAKFTQVYDKHENKVKNTKKMLTSNGAKQIVLRLVQIASALGPLVNPLYRDSKNPTFGSQISKNMFVSLRLKQPSRVSPPEDDETKSGSKIQVAPIYPQLTTTNTAKYENGTPATQVEVPKPYIRTSLSARSARGHSYKTMRDINGLSRGNFSAYSTDPTPGSDAIATAIALTKRSKALIATLAVSAKMVPGSNSTHCEAWKTKQDRDPEHSLSSSSSSSASSHPSPPKYDTPDSKLCTAVSRSNRPGSAMLLTKRKNTKPDESVSATIAIGRPRRVSSAGPTRSKSRPLPVTGSFTARNNNTYVGSINSLIQAQRSNNGQSLADSANNMLANMSQSREQELYDSRVENAPSGSQLNPQRSTSKLPEADTMGKRHPVKRLTVPKSPKFSVMSWQKKTNGSVGYAPGILR
ncbi:CMGC/MAPK protein kinase [Phytophthora palmivora]|uniref:CMGC/MAPK protein kinase n=1 Tax=Phytophthora palmivora TaxID=4796 RepID=A0A2P4XE97_9STRA|nr:CMGC/MAPK protein kinase [Phytophthora palmivora]